MQWRENNTFRQVAVSSCEVPFNYSRSEHASHTKRECTENYRMSDFSLLISTFNRVLEKFCEDSLSTLWLCAVLQGYNQNVALCNAYWKETAIQNTWSVQETAEHTHSYHHLVLPNKSLMTFHPVPKNIPYFMNISWMLMLMSQVLERKKLFEFEFHIHTNTHRVSNGKRFLRGVSVIGDVH